MDSIIQFLTSNWSELLFKTWQHFYISIIAVFLGIIVAVPVGIALTRTPKLAGVIMGIAGVIQTFPSLAILAFFIPILGVGKVPAIVALFFYSVLPILRNTYIGVKGIERNLLEAGRGMGMTGWERIRYVEIPLAIPVIMAGIRLSTVYLIGWATLAAFIGAGGLGDYIFSGLNLYQTEFIIAGAVPVTILALLVDLLLGKLENWATPKGIRKLEQAA
ncbi:ABC transporter permease [Heyndrickxia vini]|uniref:ABC transporter permease n=1 Tax=Heyndrickxia vini TaxID=1476025 RepID=A0ABX7DWS1_9BACI|nr:ABC transporter permease [Heyndrickxia vini]QQZ07772.1 ABC transporter permease [Heyndrickxia vini]